MNPIEVWIFYPSKSAHRDIKALIGNLIEACKLNKWRPVLREYKVFNKQGVISGTDVQELYLRIHKARVAVISIQPPGAAGPILFDRPTKPSTGEQINYKQTLSLRQLCLNKSFFYKMRWDRETHNWVSGFQKWAISINCSSTHDPICLPFHVFKAEGHWPKTLKSHESRKDFNNQYGTNDRKDLRSLIWKTNELHGNESIHIAGFQLPKGYHWNVNSSLNKATLYTPTEVWEVSNYVNVTPDACIRGRAPNAKRTK